MSIPNNLKQEVKGLRSHLSNLNERPTVASIIDLILLGVIEYSTPGPRFIAHHTVKILKVGPFDSKNTSESRNLDVLKVKKFSWSKIRVQTK